LRLTHRLLSSHLPTGTGRCLNDRKAEGLVGVAPFQFEHGDAAERRD
jgi:hypothetical protein